MPKEIGKREKENSKAVVLSAAAASGSRHAITNTMRHKITEGHVMASLK
jgi:hypothetical protein